MFEFLSKFKRQGVDSTRILELEMDMKNLKTRIENLEKSNESRFV